MPCASLLFAAVALVGQQTPPDPMRGLDFLLGDWESHETTKTPDGDMPFTLKGKNRLIMEGRFLQIDEAFELPRLGKFANHILISFDPKTAKYRAYWFTNRSATPLLFVGERKDAKSMVLTEAEGRMRINYEILEDGHYKAKVEAKRGDGWEQQTEAEYRRTGK